MRPSSGTGGRWKFQINKETKQIAKERKWNEYVPNENSVLAVTCSMHFVILRLRNKALDMKEIQGVQRRCR
jgi:hypothetical protein